MSNNFIDFFNLQVQDRKEHAYPPFTRLIDIIIKHIDKKQAIQTANQLADELKSKLTGVRIMGPGEPVISKIRNQYLMTMLIKIPKNHENLASLKNQIQNTISNLQKDKAHRTAKIILDVDPV